MIAKYSCIMLQKLVPSRLLAKKGELTLPPPRFSPSHPMFQQMATLLISQVRVHGRGKGGERGREREGERGRGRRRRGRRREREREGMRGEGTCASKHCSICYCSISSFPLSFPVPHLTGSRLPSKPSWLSTSWRSTRTRCVGTS